MRAGTTAAPGHAAPGLVTVAGSTFALLTRTVAGLLCALPPAHATRAGAGAVSSVKPTNWQPLPQRSPLAPLAASPTTARGRPLLLVTFVSTNATCESSAGELSNRATQRAPSASPSGIDRSVRLTTTRVPSCIAAFVTVTTPLGPPRYARKVLSAISNVDARNEQLTKSRRPVSAGAWIARA